MLHQRRSSPGASEVEQLQEDAAEAGENAQAAKVQLAKLKSQLSSVQQEAEARKLALTRFEISRAIAVARYKSTGLGEGSNFFFIRSFTVSLLGRIS